MPWRRRSSISPEPGETVIVTEVGKFSERWREIADVFGVRVVVVKTEYGEVAAPEQVEKAFKENPGAKVLFTTHSETSTGALQDVERVRAGRARS